MKKKVLGVVFAVLAWNTAESQCSQYPVLDIGNDTMLCQRTLIDYPDLKAYNFPNWNVVSENPSDKMIDLPAEWISNMSNVKNSETTIF